MMEKSQKNTNVFLIFRNEKSCSYNKEYII